MKNKPNFQPPLKFQKRSSYGHDRIYPVCDRAKLITQLTGRKTLFPQDLAVIETLGFEIRWQDESKTSV